MHAEGIDSLRIAQFYRVISVPLGNRRITQEKLRKEIGSWRIEEKSYEKSNFPMRIFEDCTESRLAVRAKTLCNLDIFPPFMIIQIVRFLAEAFLRVLFCVSCVVESSSMLYVFCLILLKID